MKKIHLPEITAKRGAIMLAVILALQLAFLTYFFAVKKSSFHNDETFTFGLSNSFYAPFTSGLNPNDKRDTSNAGQMLAGNFFEEYYTVGDDDAFSYGSVIHNQRYDVHPPLYYLIFHTISSFFPHRMTKWFGYAINAPCFIIGQIFLYLLVCKMTKSRFWGLLACGFWGFTISSVDCFALIRMYSLLVAETTAFVYFQYKLFDAKEPSLKKHLLPIGFCTFLGFLTHHYFMPFAFIITVLLCLIYLIKRQYKKLLKYGLSVLCGALAGLAAFPFTISHMLNTDTSIYGQSREVKFDFITSARIMLMYTLKQLFGVQIGPISSGNSVYIVAALVFLSALFIPLAFLFRKSEKFILFLKKGKALLALCLRRVNLFAVILLVSAVSVLCLTSYFINIAILDMNAPRYMFFILPSCIAVITLILADFARLLGRFHFPGLAAKALSVSLAVFFVISSNTNAAANYVRRSLTFGEADIPAGSDVIYVMGTTIYAQEFGFLVLNANRLFIDKYHLENNSKDLKDMLSGDETVYILAIVDPPEWSADLAEFNNIEYEPNKTDEEYGLVSEPNLPEYLDYLHRLCPERTARIVGLRFENNCGLEIFVLEKS